MHIWVMYYLNRTNFVILDFYNTFRYNARAVNQGKSLYFSIELFFINHKSAGIQQSLKLIIESSQLHTIIGLSSYNHMLPSLIYI